MRSAVRRAGLILAVAIVPVWLMSQGQILTLIVSGHDGSVPVTQINGRNYVEVESLARVINGSVSYNGNQMTLVAGTGKKTEAATALSEGKNLGQDVGFSREFLRAGIEAMSTIREWHSALATAIRNQYPLEQSGLTPSQTQAATALRLAQAAVLTDDDKKAAQLIVTEYARMKQLSDKYLAKRTNLNYISPDALQNDALDQSLVSCGRALGTMAAAGQFTDDPACQ